MRSWTFIALLFAFESAWSQIRLRYEGYVEDGGTPVNALNESFSVVIRKPSCASPLGLPTWNSGASVVINAGEFSITPDYDENLFAAAMDPATDWGGGFCAPGSAREMHINWRGETFVVALQDAPRAAFSKLAQAAQALGGRNQDQFLKIDTYAAQTPLNNAQVNTLLQVVAGTYTLSGDLDGSLAAPVVDGIRGVGVVATAPALNQVLKFNGTQWAPAADDVGAAIGDASYAARGIVQFDTNLATSGISVAAGIASLPNTITAAGPIGAANTIPVITYDNKGRLTTVSTATVNDATKLPLAGGTMTGPINMGNQSITNSSNVSATGVAARTLTVYDADNSNYATLVTPTTLAANYNLTLPTDDGAAGQVLTTDGAGVLSWTSSAAGDITDVVAGTGLTGGAATGSATLNVNVGLGVNQIPQILGTALTANKVLVTNPTATGLAQLNCTVGQVIKYDATGNANCDTDLMGAANSFVQDGNSFGIATRLGTNDNTNLFFETNGMDRMVIRNTGEVGIGTATPVSPLDVEGSISGDVVSVQNNSVSGWSAIQFNDNLNGNRGSVGFGNTGASHSAGLMQIQSLGQDFIINAGVGAGQERLRINHTNGNIGIASATPGARLDVNGDLVLRGRAAPAVSSAGQGKIYFDSTSNRFRVSENGGAYTDLVSSGATAAGTNGQIQFNNAGAFGASSNLYWDNTNSRLGLGTTNPSRNLHVNGPMRLTPVATPGSPVAGDIFFDSADLTLKFYDGISWIEAGGADLSTAGIYAPSNTNTRIGLEAGSNYVGSNFDNSAFGYRAGRNMSSTASGNTVVGSLAGENITSGNENVLIGSAAGSSLTTQSNNTFIGNYSGSSVNGVGFGNVIIGSNSGSVIANSSNNILLSAGDGVAKLHIHPDGMAAFAGPVRFGMGTCNAMNMGAMQYIGGTDVQICNGSTWTNVGGGGGFTPPAVNTRSSPSYHFQGDTASGLYQESGGDIGLTTGGTERVRIKPGSGFMAILGSFGAADPIAPLHVLPNTNGSQILAAQFEGFVRIRRNQDNTGTYEPSLIVENTNGMATSAAVTEYISWDGGNPIPVAREIAGKISGGGAYKVQTRNPGTLNYQDAFAADENQGVTFYKHINQFGTISPPASIPGTGRIYFDSTANRFRVSENGGAYVDLVGSGGGLPATPGTAASPGYAFTSDIDTGMYNQSANTLGFSAGGTATMFVTPAGLGIGTTIPERPLHVMGPMRLQPMGLPGSGQPGDLFIDSGDGNKLKYYNGTIWSEVGGNFNTVLNGGNSFAVPMTIGTSDNFDFNFETNNIQRMTITSTGDVGVYQRMSVGAPTTNGANLQVLEPTSSPAYLNISNLNSGAMMSDGLLISAELGGISRITNMENSSLRFGTNGMDQMTIDSVGNVGIGTTAPIENFELNGTFLMDSTGGFIRGLINGIELVTNLSSTPIEIRSNGNSSPIIIETLNASSDIEIRAIGASSKVVIDSLGGVEINKAKIRPGVYVAPNFAGGVTTINAPNGEEVVRVSQASGTNTISTISGCNEGIYTEGQKVTIVLGAYGAGTLIFQDTAGTLNTANSLALSGNTNLTFASTVSTGSTLTLMCSYINNATYKWVEVSRSVGL